MKNEIRDAYLHGLADSPVPADEFESRADEYMRESMFTQRRITQLLTAGDELLALCDDGTVWSFDRELQQWVKVPGVPV